MLQNNDVTKSYLAGIVDGEGHVGIHPNNNGQYYGQILIEMTNREPIEMFQKMFGGNIQKKVLKSGKPAYRYLVSKDKEIEFIDTISPFLKIKNPQAQCIKELTTVHKKYPIKGGSYKSEASISTQKRLYNLVKAFNA